MRLIEVKENEAGQRLDKLLFKFFDNAPKSFVYKMLRKKNIVLNGKKAEGKEILVLGDNIKLFLAEDTIEAFSKKTENYIIDEKDKKNFKLDILYEDKDMLLINKPAGVLSQKAEKNDVSMVEYVMDYMISSKQITTEELNTFKPAVVNRLDRNTSGIIVAGKTLNGLQSLSRMFQERNLHKYYVCVVNGVVDVRKTIEGYLVKDEKTNKVVIYQKKPAVKTAEYIKTEYIPVCNNGKITLLKVCLYTGKSHQIRAHLSSEGHSLIGDYKYGKKSVNDFFKKQYGIEYQMLHSYELILPDKRTFIAPLPKEYEKLLRGEKVWQHGTAEALEALH